MDYFLKHWKGELDLRIAFWINLVLINLILLGFSYLSDNIPFLEHPQTASRFAISFLLFNLGLYVWQVVGTWRCGKTYKEKTKKRGFANFTRFMIVVGVISSFNDLNQNFALYKDAFEVSFGKDEFSDYSLTISEDGSKIYLIGGFGFGISEEFEDLLKENSEVTMVVLESPGGWVYEGQKVSEAITNNGLDTATLSYCESACTLAFISGKSRYISQTANLGFHAFSTQVIDPVILMISGQDPLVEWTLELFQNQGVSEEFINTMFRATNEDMWYPSIDELIESKVVYVSFFDQLLDDNINQGVVSESFLINTNSADFAVQDIEEGLLQIEFFQTIKFYEPDLFLDLVIEFKEKADKGATYMDLTIMMSQKTQEWVPILIPSADDKTLMAYAQTITVLLKKLNDIDPFLCLKAVYPERLGTLRFGDYFSNKEFQPMLSILNDMLVSLYTQTPPELDYEKAEISRLYILVTLGDNFLSVPLEEMKGGEDYRLHCSEMVKFFEEILKLKSERAGNLLRVLLAE